MKFILVLLSLVFMVSCSESVSKPAFNFKPATQNGVVAKMGTIEITEAELNDGIEAELYDAEQKLFEVKFNRLRSLVMQKIMDQDPKKKGLSNDEYLEKFIASGVVVSEKDIDAFIKKQQIPQEHLNPMVTREDQGLP